MVDGYGQYVRAPRRRDADLGAVTTRVHLARPGPSLRRLGWIFLAARASYMASWLADPTASDANESDALSTYYQRLGMATWNSPSGLPPPSPSPRGEKNPRSRQCLRGAPIPVPARGINFQV